MEEWEMKQALDICYEVLDTEGMVQCGKNKMYETVMYKRQNIYYIKKFNPKTHVEYGTVAVTPDRANVLLRKYILRGEKNGRTKNSARSD